MELSAPQTKALEIIKASGLVIEYGGSIPKSSGFTYKVLNALSDKGLIESELIRNHCGFKIAKSTEHFNLSQD